MFRIICLVIFSTALNVFCLYAQTPTLSSRPTSANILYLDFDGETTVGTLWNPDIAIYAPSNLSSSDIQGIWRATAELYSIFDVNVTTDRAIFDKTAPSSRMMVIHTPTCSNGQNQSCGVCGIAYINSFGRGTPAIVNCYINSTNRIIYSITAHEIGHTLGLAHQPQFSENDCSTPQRSYNAGYNSIGNNLGWAAIMGANYQFSMNRWSDGFDPVSKCKFAQNDMEYLRLSVGVIEDDFGNSISTAGSISFHNSVPCATCPICNFTENSITGYINYINDSTIDIDFFKIDVSAPTTRTISVSPYELGETNYFSTNLILTIYDQNGTIILTKDEPTLANIPEFNYFFPQGTYYFSVSVNEYPVRENTATVASKKGQLGRYIFKY